MQVELIEARASDEPVLANLLSLYIHDFSEILGFTPNPDGRFVYDRLPLYFAEPGRSAFLIRSQGELAGFALVTRGSVISGSPDVWDLSEFFVVRGLRRRGVGCIAAARLFERFPGTWEVRAMALNEGAGEFWASAISQHTAGAFQEESWTSEIGRTFRVFRFSQPSSS